MLIFGLNAENFVLVDSFSPCKLPGSIIIFCNKLHGGKFPVFTVVGNSESDTFYLIVWRSAVIVVERSVSYYVKVVLDEAIRKEELDWVNTSLASHQNSAYPHADLNSFVHRIVFLFVDCLSMKCFSFVEGDIERFWLRPIRDNWRTCMFSAVRIQITFKRLDSLSRIEEMNEVKQNWQGR